MQKIRHILEAIVVIKLYYFFKIMPIDMASAFGSFVAKKIGPLLAVHKLAEKNMKNAMPDLSDADVQKYMVGMWDNLGRVVGEFPHVGNISKEHMEKIIEVEGFEHVEASHKSGKASFIMSAHFGNWEFLPRTLFEKSGIVSNLIYRKSNNPYIDKLIIKTRGKYAENSIPKGSVGARQLINAIKEHKQICMLIDQKQNDGIAVPFFHKEAMTPPAIANLAIKYDCIILPVQITRMQGAKFKMKVHPPMQIVKTDNNSQDILRIMTEANLILEGWIREHPEQWFWVHNRWPKL
jgi:KDO2-lipid IV(A) lauroyltransferase